MCRPQTMTERTKSASPNRSQSRALAIAFEGTATGAMVLLPIANVGALIGRSRWLALYPALLSSALASAGVGLLLAMLFFITFGPRRARLLSQLAATLLGASFVLTAQAIGILPTHMREALIESFANPPPGSWLDHRGPLWLPVRAALGEPLALAWVALSAEDAPDFLTSAPVTRGEVERRKIEAIALPIGLILAVPILGLAFASPWAAICATLFALGAGVFTTLVNLWRQAPARRVMVLRRHSQSRLAALIERLS
jgi:hypothetical protein